jgi:hypothetical protein
VSQIVDALRDAAAYVSGNFELLAGAASAKLWPSSSRRWAAFQACVRAPSPETAALASAIRADSALSALDRLTLMNPLGPVGQDLSVEAIAAALVLAHLESLEADDAVARLLALAEANRAEGRIVAPIDGLAVHRRIDLDEHLSIMPFGDAGLVSEPTPYALGGSMDRFGLNVHPTAAIVLRTVVEPLFLDWRPVADGLASIGHISGVQARWDLVEELERAVAITSAGAAMGLGAEAIFDDPLLRAFPSTSTSRSIKPQSRLLVAPVEVCEHELREAVQALRSFKSTHKKATSTVAIVADRIVGARRAATLADRALDLGMALEALLMFNERERGEISFKMRTRAAWLLGATPDQRKTILMWVRNLYNLRSSVAHGSVPDETLRIDGRTVNVMEALDVGSRLCREVAISLFAMPESFAWDDVVAGAALERRDTSSLLHDLTTRTSD